MIDRVKFFTNKNRSFGPYGGDGGSSRASAPRGEHMCGYLRCLKCAVVQTQDLPGIVFLSFVWSKHKTGNYDEENSHNVHVNRNQFYYTDESDIDEDGPPEYSDTSE